MENNKEEIFLTKEEQNKIWKNYPFKIKEKIINLYKELPIDNVSQVLLDVFGYENLNGNLTEYKFRDIEWKLIDVQGNTEVFAATNHYPITKIVNHSCHSHDYDYEEFWFGYNFYTDEEELIHDLEENTDEWWEHQEPLFKKGQTVSLSHRYDSKGIIIEKIKDTVGNYYKIKPTKWFPRCNNSPSTVIISEEDLVFNKDYKERLKNKNFR